MNKFFTLSNKKFVYLIFLCLSVYIILRAIFVEPMLDELATFYSYIQTGHIMDHQSWVDANNHLLNSYVGWRMYTLFGDHFILYRILAICSFPIYFFSLKWLVERFVKSKFNGIVFIAVTTIPWIVEYFGFSRGYGPSLAFFFAGLCFIIRFKTEFKSIFFFACIFFFALSISANLSLLIPSTMCLLYALLVHILEWKKIQAKWLSFIAIVLYLKFLGKILNHIDKLKEANALWWGSRNGLWEVTGKSLSRNVFFTETIAIKYLLIVILLGVVVLWIVSQKQKSLKAILLSDLFWIPGVFLACICAIVFMAKVMEINYPMDRVAMYFVPLLLIVTAGLFSLNRYLEYLLLTFIWFPISFVIKINLDTSIFSPEDRFSKEFSAQLKKNVEDNDAISVDYVSHLSYAYTARKNIEKAHIAIESINDPTVEQGEYHVSWINDYQWQNFDKIYDEPNAKTRLYKRKNSFKKVVIFDTILPMIHSKEMIIPLVKLKLSKSLKGEFVQSQVESSVILDQGTLSLNVVNQVENNLEKPRIYQRSRFEWYFGHELKYGFNFPNYPMKIENDDTFLSIFMVNGEGRDVKLKKTHIRFYKILNESK